MVQWPCLVVMGNACPLKGGAARGGFDGTMKTSVDLHRFLLERDVQHEIVPVEAPTRTCERTALELGLSPRDIAKCVFFEVDDSPVQVVLSGDKKVDYGRLKHFLGASGAKLASPEQVLEWTSYPLGATPPVGIECSPRTVVDKSLSGSDVVYTGSGEPHSILKLRLEDLLKLTSAEVADVSS